MTVFCSLEKNELVSTRLTKDCNIFTQNSCLENIRGVLLHPFLDEFFGFSKQEFECFSVDWPSETAWREVGVVGVGFFIVRENDKNNGDNIDEDRTKKRLHG